MSNYPRIDRPTEPGWYWYRLDAIAKWQAVRVYEDSGRLRVMLPGREARYLVENLREHQWRGPIPEPQE